MADPDHRDPRLVRVATSFAALSPDNDARRMPRAPWRPRPRAFWNAFEDRALWYDAFWNDRGDAILLVGPTPLNLEAGLRSARYRALPSGTSLTAGVFPSRSTAITALDGAPEGTTHVEVTGFGETFRLAVQPNLSARLAGARVLFAINKDNRLDWIGDWAHWHACLHGTDAVIVFDNGSSAYSSSDLEAALLAVPGLAHVAVVPMPHRFGPVDPSVVMTRFYPRFLQISVTQIALRRFAMAAAGVINCDIDELAWAGDESLYDRVRASELGALRMRGRWIEAAREPAAPQRHASFALRHSDARHRLSPSKWALDPRRDWVRPLSVQPYLHRIHGAPEIARRHDDRAMFFHFKGINTNWKHDRTESGAGTAQRLVKDEALALAWANFAARCKGSPDNA